MSNRSVSGLRANGANRAASHVGPALARTVRAGGFLLLLGALLAVSHMFLARAVGALLADTIAGFAETAGTPAIALGNARANGTTAKCATALEAAARPTDRGPHRDLRSEPTIAFGDGRAANAAAEISKTRGRPDGHPPGFWNRIGLYPFPGARICPRHESFRHRDRGFP